MTLQDRWRRAARISRVPPTGRERRGRGRLSLVLGVAVVVAATATVIAGGADRPAGAVAETDTHTGRATYYSLGDSGLGNCSFPVVPADRWYAALGPEDYDHAGGCGGYIDVTGPKGTVRLLAADKCPECESGHLDMSPEAFAKIGDLSAGVIPITYRGVRDPAGVGPISIRVKEGSSRWWIGFLAMNHGNPLVSMQYRTDAGDWRDLTRAEYNYWLKEDGAGPGPFTLRLTDIYGNQAVVDDIALSPSVDQMTDAWMYQGGPAASVSPASPASPASPPASASGSSGTATPRPSATATTVPPRSAGASCSATAKVNTMWTTGFQASVTVRNGGTMPIDPWVVAWALPSGVTVTEAWNATVSQHGQSVTAAAPSWNTTIAPGDTVTIGFNAARPAGSGTVLAAIDGSVHLNDTPCTG